jgi:hypothetical protein
MLGRGLRWLRLALGVSAFVVLAPVALLVGTRDQAHGRADVVKAGDAELRAWGPFLGGADPSGGPTARRAVSVDAGRGTRSGQASGPRPFEHRRHERLPCAECHGSGERHRSITVQAPRDCAACHHDARRGFVCSDCHHDAELARSHVVERAVSLSVWPRPRMRTLSFPHTRHAQISCRACHARPVTLAADRGCGTCHVDHHAREADCASCHRDVERSVHVEDAHLSCSGSGCHAMTIAPTFSRNLCLMCHAEQADHEVGNDCAPCHHVADLSSARIVRDSRTASWSGRRP